MGNTVAQPELTPEQEDLKLLGQRVPFGDHELADLYETYLLWLHCSDDERNDSFLYDWSLLRGRDRGSALADRIKESEERILPLNFGNALYQACFCAPGDEHMYALTNAALPPNGGGDSIPAGTTLKVGEQCIEVLDEPPRGHFVDEYTRRARLEAFFDGLADCSRRGAKPTLTALFEIERVLQHGSLPSVEGNHPRISARSLVHTGYRIALASAFLLSDQGVDEFLPDENGGDVLLALALSIVEKGRRRRQRSGLPGCTTTECPFLQQGLVELEDVLEWADAVAGMFASVLPTFFHSLLFPDIPFPRSRAWFATPIPDQGSDFFNAQSSPTTMNTRIFVIACLSSSLTGSYHRLYASSSDGLSFNRLQNAVQGYGGPTLLLIRSTSGGIFGAFTASTWKESKDFYGNTDCFLLQLSPRTAVYRPTANERNFMYCNSAARSKGYDQQAHGIGFGGSVQEPRLFLPESFEDCVAASQDLTFENGRLLPDLDVAGEQQSKKYFDIDSLEVWGVGGSDVVQAAFQARDASRAITDEAIRRARKVDKAQFLDDFRAGTIESKAFQHRQQIDGRADCDVQDRNQDRDKVYEYAK
jgi:TLD